MHARGEPLRLITGGILLVVAVLAGACTSYPGSSPPPSPGSTPSATAPPAGAARPVIVDTDMAADDWLAILYLLGRPEVRVEAISVTGVGEAHCEPGIRNALGLVALAGQPEIPVACGRETPLAGSHTFPQAWREGVDGVFGLSLPDNPNAPSSGTAGDLLAATLDASPRKVAVLALGPLTNLGELLDATPDLVDRIESVYAMGGAIDVDGNVGASGVGIDNPFAEWNLYLDPVAADLVVRSGAGVTLVPLDATNDVPTTIEFVDRLSRDSGTPGAAFGRDVLFALRESIASGGYYLWDPLAAALLVDEGLGTFDSRSVVVVTEEGPESGRTRAAEDGTMIRFANGADAARFEDLFVDTLNGRAR